MKYRWRDLAFDVDDDLDDHTMVVLTKPGKGPLPAMTLCVATDKATSLAAYVDEALREMATSVSGFRLGSRQNATLMGQKAVVVEARTLSPEGLDLIQKQAFVERDRDTIVVITGSAPEGSAKDLAAAVDRLLASLSRTAP